MAGSKQAVPVTVSKKLQRIIRALPVLSIALFACGVAVIVYFPTDNFSNNTYLSENALLPAVADATFGPQDYSLAVSLTRRYRDHLLMYDTEGKDAGYSISEWRNTWIVETLVSLGIDDVYTHAFVADGKRGLNTVGMVHARRTSGREALVLTSHDDHRLMRARHDDSTVSSLCAGMALMKHLRSVKWLSKDIIFVATDSSHGDSAIKVWLEEYHRAPKTKVRMIDGAPRKVLAERGDDVVQRAGKLRGALALDFVASHFSYIVVCPEGVSGKLPNLDLMNAIDRVAAYGESVYTTLFDTEDFLTQFSHRFKEFTDLSIELRSLLLFMVRAASGTGTGDHGWFHMYNIDAVTLRVQQPAKGRHNHMLKLVRTVEGTVRCLSNLIEHLHQSFYYYLLSATFRYVSIGQYLAPFFAVLASVVLGPAVDVLLFASAPSASAVEVLRAVARFLPFEIFGLVLYLSIQKMLPEIFYIYLAGALLALVVARAVDRIFVKRMGESDVEQVQAYVVGVTLLPGLVFLGTFFMLNFSFCYLAAVAYAPFAFFMLPSKRAKVNKVKGVLCLALSLPVLLYACLQVQAHFGVQNSVTELITQLLHIHERYSNLIVPFLCFVYAPTNLSFMSWNLLHI